YRFGLVEDLGIQGADGRRLRSASKGVSVLNSDDPSCQIPSDGSHRRASPRNLYGRSFLMRGSMVFPLAVAMATVPAAEELARGEAEFLRGNVHCHSSEVAEAVACYERAAGDAWDADVWWNRRVLAPGWLR